MGKGLGIAVLIVAAIGIVIPVAGIYIGVITALLGIVVGVLKERALAVAIGALNILDAMFLTPSLSLAHLGSHLAHGPDVARVVFWIRVICGVGSIMVALLLGRSSTTDGPSTARV